MDSVSGCRGDSVALWCMDLTTTGFDPRSLCGLFFFPSLVKSLSFLVGKRSTSCPPGRTLYNVIRMSIHNEIQREYLTAHKLSLCMLLCSIGGFYEML